MATHDQWETDTGLQLLSSAGIDSLPNGWTVRQLGSMLAEERGVAVGVMYPGEHTTGGIPLIRAGELTGSVINDRPGYRISPEVHHEYRRTALEGGELLITLVGEVGLCAVVPNSMRGWNAARALAVVRLANPSDAAFVRLCLISPPIRHLMHVWCNTTVQATLNLKDLRLLPIPWPPEADRSAIARAIGSLDDKIEQNRRTGTKLEELARAVFKAWFVDFEPVKAKVAGATAFPGMSPETFSSLPTSLTDSTIGPVPQGWEVTRWGEIASLEYGKSLKGYQDGTGSFRVFGTNGPIGWHTAQLAGGPGIVIGRKGAYRGVHYSQGPFWAIDTAFYLKPKKSFSWKWAYYELLRVDINGMDSGSAIPSTSREDFYSLSVCLPPVAMLKGFDAAFSPVFEMFVTMNTESAKLTALRDYLLPRLMSGQLRVREAESLLERAV